MTSPFLLLALTAQIGDAPPAGPASADITTFTQCVATASEDPLRGIEAANAWMQTGGGLLARQCLGTALNNAGRHDAAEIVLVEAATQADSAANPLRGALWGMAGIAALGEGEAATALAHFDRSISAGTLAGEALGQVHATRARARVALGDMPGARADLNQATALAPQDGTIWLLSATLARRMADGERAQNDIQQAAAVSPRDPAVALEAGIIAWLYDDYEAARRSFESAIAINPNGPIAAVARRHLTDMQVEMQASTVSRPTPADTPVSVQTVPQSR